MGGTENIVSLDNCIPPYACQ
ncbi:PTS transporter subunit EIIB [Salmonella enterica]|uniref:Uncharacterized protein n=9 Tax=Salmonella enterica I TaxID=59201 RepID=A0A3V2FU85_SALET|nr:hypothetical protein CHE19_13235 [Salmonella enterica]EAA0918479.1 hypothetical protein [Salmonella enterica subsp. enterica serovar Enteritidis]EAA1125832.1 hypothetical protein [Salmonella enterica subsp. enterica serovar Heidelberg]EAA1280751.1 hypothetical protein [Salmonella enterica subsp. enterica serovar Manhattan]EAA1764680.1 hypothetical protein [Salmonella enterica subsp. enterica serovar Braenderup]EAA3739496.1 hypothetical protein [Salmonella enterica subsp. enterica serovar Vi